MKYEQGQHRTGERGFTLVELLVAMTMLGLLSLTLFGGLRFGIRAWDRTEEHIVGMDEVRAVQTLMRRFIERAYPLYLNDDQNSPHIDFDGGPDALAFLAPAPMVLADGGYARISLRAEIHGNEKSLVIAMTPESTLMKKSKSWPEEKLITNIINVEFSYFGKSQSAGNPQWHERWQGRKDLPQLIRIRMEFPDGDSRYWPELVAALHVYADVDCVFDQLTKDCQGR